MRRVLVMLFVIGLCALPATVSAQEAGKKALTVGFPVSAGVLLHVTDSIAIRPDFSFATSWNESQTTESDSDVLGVGFSVLFYAKKWDQVSAYWTPRVAWQRTTSSSESKLSGFSGESTTNSYGFSGSFGVQGWIGTRFSAFGEVGIGYTHATGESSGSSFKATSDTVSTRSGVGIAFYF